MISLGELKVQLDKDANSSNINGHSVILIARMFHFIIDICAISL